MEWVKIDDNLPDHPKVLAIPREHRAEAMWLFVRANCYCSRNLTDGFVPLGYFDDAQATVQHLLEVGLLDDAPPTGYRVHDYLDYNRSKEQVEEFKAKRKAAGQKGGLATAQARATANATASATAKRQQNRSKVQAEADTDTEREPPLTPPSGFGEVIKAIEKASGSTVSSKDQATVSGWCRTFATETILQAIRNAVASGKVNVAYIGGILKRLDSEPAPERPQGEEIKFGVLYR